TLTYSATDNAMNQESPKTLTVQIDKTKPVITGSRSPAANSNGWNNTNVTVSFNCADAGSVQSGIVTNTVAGQTLSSEGAEQSVTNTGSCVDKAGNTANPVTISGINIDKTLPTVLCGSTDGLWHASDVSIACNASDGGSGLANAAAASFNLSTSVPNGTETANAATTSR